MTTACKEATTPAAPPLRAHLNRRLGLLMHLPRLDAQRHALHKQAGRVDPITRELTRQVREKRRPPDAEHAAETLERLREQADRLDEQGELSAAQRRHLCRALQLGMKQATVFVHLHEATSDMLAAAIESVDDEPLLAVFRQHAIEADDLFSWAVYGRALSAFEQRLGERAPGATDAGKVATLRQAVAWEWRVCEPIRTAAFWRCYEHAAALLVNGKLTALQKQYVRCFLRHAHVIHAPWMLDPAVSRECLAECGRAIVDYDGAAHGLTALHADEYIDLAAWGYITPSPDEDLELNGRHTGPWKLDRLRRRLIHGRHTEAALHKTRGDLLHRIDRLDRDNEQIEQQMRQLDRRSPQYHAQRTDLREQVQRNKVTTARLRRTLDSLDQRKMPSVRENISDAEQKLEQTPCQTTPEQLARFEARSIRRFCRLCAHLHEPFLPGQAADAWLEPDRLNDRATVVEAIGEIERRDPTLFKWPLAHAKKPEDRVHVRQAAYVLIVPGSGQMALSVNPRTGNEVGRLVVPLWSQRRDMLEPMLNQALADFRFDTARHSGGVDWMHSDTLSAAYATVRWNYRKRGRDRREKAAIDSHQTDRVNFRRHYRLFLESADTGGRKLFFKCPEIYDAFLQYMMLPAGVERCKRS